MENDALFRQLIQQTDPYSPYLGATNAINFRATKPGQETTAMGVGFAKAILAGLLQGKSQNRALEQTSLMNDLLRGGDMSADIEGLDPRISASMKQKYLADKLERDTERDDVLRLHLDKLKIDETGRLPSDTISALPAVFTSKSDSTSEPTTLEELRRLYSDKRAREIFENQTTEDREEKKSRYSVEDNQTDRIIKLPAVQALNEVNSTLARLSDLANVDTKSSDIPFATIFIGGLDGSVVREGEYARASESNNLLDKYRNKITSTLEGGSELGVEVKRQMFRELMKLQKGIQSEAERAAKPFANIAKKRTGQELDLPFEVGYEFQDPFKDLPVVKKKGVVESLNDTAKNFLGGSPTPTPTPSGGDAALIAELKKRRLL